MTTSYGFNPGSAMGGFTPANFGASWGSPAPQPMPWDQPQVMDLTNPLEQGYAPQQPGLVPSTFGAGWGSPTAGQPPGNSSWNWFNSTDKNGVTSQGALMPMLGAAQGLFNGWLGMKQYGLAKDQLATSKQQFGLNYDAQRTTTNTQLQDRQLARVASNPGAYQSVGDYMSTNGIKPRGG